MKKRYKILIAIVILVILIPSFNYFVLRDSVMEEIYRAVYWGSYTGINEMEGINTQSYMDCLDELEMGGCVTARFKEEYIDDNFSIRIYLWPEETRKKWDEDIDICATYLSEYDLTVENITEFQEYILYDVVYQSWVSGTDNGRKLNKWDYRNIKVVDNTFAEWE